MTVPLIIQVVQHLQPGGLESLALDLNEFTHANGIIVSLEGTKKEALKKWPRLLKLQHKLYFFDKKQGLDLDLITKLQRFFKQTQPSLIQTHHIGPLLYAGIAAKRAGITNIIHTEHDIWHLQQPKRRWLQRAALSLIQPQLVANSPHLAKTLKQFFPQQKVTTIANGIDTQRFIFKNKAAQRKKYSLPQSAILLGSAGRLEKVKGQDLLIAALCLLPEKVHLAIAGNGSQNAILQQRVQQLNLNQRVHFIGHIDEVESFYPALDIFCLPSRNEGYPLSALEAQACGIPTAVTDVGAAKETLCSKTGVLLKANSIPSMAASLLSMINSLNTKKGNPRQFVCEKNDIRHIVSCYDQLNQQIKRAQP